MSSSELPPNVPPAVSSDTPQKVQESKNKKTLTEKVFSKHVFSSKKTSNSSLKDKKITPESLTSSLHKTKNRERRLVFNALQKAAGANALPKEAVKKIEEDITSDKTKEKRGLHAHLNRAAKGKLLLQLAIKSKGVQLISAKNENLSKEAKALAKTAKELKTLLQEAPEDKDLKDVNFKAIQLLRQAFTNKAYEALKENEDNPTIRFLHDVNIALYTQVNLIDAYVEGEDSLGKKLVEGDESEYLFQSLESVRKDATENRGLFSSHGSLTYIRKHFKQFWGAFTSQKIGSFFGKYDPHGNLENNAGALFKESIIVTGTDKKATSLDVRTPSPTIGDKVSPEFRAALQAIENQRVAELSGEEGFRRPNAWVYTNYQEMTNKGNGEHGRSRAIMKLNEEFPMVFKGITLSKDSNYFKDGIGHGKEMWKGVEKDSLDKYSVEQFVQEMKEKFKDPNHFTLEDRDVNKGEKLYFPDPDPENFPRIIDIVADESGKLLEKILDDHEKTTGSKKLTGENAWKAKAAVKEFAYAAIQRYVQAEAIRQLADEGVTPSIITTAACKEDIDRGFSDHIKRMYFLGGDKKLLAQIANMPALMARFRVILEDRIQPLIGVTEYIKPEDARGHLNKVSEELKVETGPIEIGQAA